MADRKPGIPGAVVQTNDELYVVNGRLSRGFSMTVPEEVFEQYRLGYRCLNCHHYPQPEAFPDECCEPYCKFPIKTKQLAMLEHDFKGESDLVPDQHDDNDLRRQRLMDDGLWLPGFDN